MNGKLLTISIIAVVMLGGRAYGEEPEDQCRFAIGLLADQKARSIGDLLTILVEEESEAERDASTRSNKKTGMSGSMSFGHPRLDNRPTAWTNAVVPEWSVDVGKTYEGGGQTRNSEKLSSRLTATVMDVLPNGNLLIEGRRSMTIGRDRVTVVLSGIVRPKDVNAANSVMSSSVADASIRYESAGPLARDQKRGLLNRLSNLLNLF
jgi:flagellar L-ring protein precursor FlgH